jgi:putative addiction module killer protein
VGEFMEYEIKIYETSTGKCPFDKWLNDLKDRKAQVAVDLRLERIKMGNFGQCKSLGNMIFELKIDVGPGYRVYFGKIGTKIILLLCAGDKRSQQSDIEKAKKYFQEFKNSGART